MPSKEKKYGKGPRSASRIGRQYKNKLWRRKKLTQIAVSSDHELDHEARSDDNSHKSDDEQSLEVPSDLEDVVNEIVSELDHSPIERPIVLVRW